MDDEVPTHTRRATETWLAVFTAFCAEQNIQIDLTMCAGEELNQVLSKFYPSLRTKKGELYKKASCYAVRAAIHRKVREFNRPFNIFKSECFAQSHGVLEATLRSKQGEGLGPAVQHKEPLSAEDCQRLQVYFAGVLAAINPVKLSMYVWYVITFHFGLRAREVQVPLKKASKIVSETDSEYVILQTDFASKNCPGGTSG